MCAYIYIQQIGYEHVVRVKSTYPPTPVAHRRRSASLYFRSPIVRTIRSRHSVILICDVARHTQCWGQTMSFKHRARVDVALQPGSTEQHTQSLRQCHRGTACQRWSSRRPKTCGGRRYHGQHCSIMRLGPDMAFTYPRTAVLGSTKACAYKLCYSFVGGSSVVRQKIHRSHV